MIEFGGNVVALPNTNLPFIAHFRAILIEFDICRKLFYFKYEFKKLMRNHNKWNLLVFLFAAI